MADIHFNCPACSKSLEIDEKGAGLMIKCPDCGASVQVPVISPPASSAKRNCPHCHAVVKDSDPLCMSCGFNFRTGRMPGGVPQLAGTRPVVPATPKTSKQETNPNLRCPGCGKEVGRDDAFCVRCGTKLKTGQIDGQVVDGMAAQHEGVRLRLKDTPPSLPIPTPPAAPYNPPLTTDPVRRQVAFDCPHCGINIQGVAYTGESVKCLTCGGYVIVPEPAKASIIVRVGGAFLLICFLLVVIGWFLGLTSPSSQSQSGTTASESQAPSVHALGADDALSLYGRGDMDNALQASKISRRIQSDPEYERSFRDQWRYLDNKAALEYQRATGR